MQRINESLWITKFKLELNRLSWRGFVNELIEYLDFPFVTVTYRDYNKILKKLLYVEVMVKGNRYDSQFIDKMLNQFFTEKDMTVRCYI